jgi:hypothetical protein
MKLKGILSAKSKREVWERNESRRAPAQCEQSGSVHKPLPGEHGTIWCCGARHTPAAQERHMRGERLAMSCGHVAVTGSSDPWLDFESARIKAVRRDPSDDEEARIRAEQVARYYEEQARKRPQPRQAQGASGWMTD